MAANEVHVGDWGTSFTLTFRDGTAIVDISGASTRQVWLKDPRGGVSKNAAAFVTDGSDGKLKYDLQDGDIYMPGVWSMQGFVSGANGAWHTDIHEFTVTGNVDA